MWILLIIYINNCLKIGKYKYIKFGQSIIINEKSLFSSDIIIRRGDSHYIMDKNRKRINPSKSVMINEHLWVANRVKINKWDNIKKNSVIGAGTIVIESINEENVIIGGSPAKVIKRDINWDINRI